MHIRIDTVYSACPSNVIELPDGIVWSDIKQWYVKWGTFHFQLKGENITREIELFSDPTDALDWERPAGIAIYEVDENYDLLNDDPIFEDF